MTDKQKKLDEVAKEIAATKGGPFGPELNPVPGEGNPEAKVMFIGEAPGKNEAQTGRPFCGASGRVLTEMINHIGLERKDVYITNIVKDRPPDNRDPVPNEIKIYSSFLDRQIEAIQPKVVATLGRYSMAYVMQKYGLENELKTISQIISI